MRYKIWITRFTAIALTVAVTFGILGYMTRICEREYSRYTYQGYFDKDEDYDVLFLGSSKVINGFFPMQLYKDYGITSFNFGAHSNLIPSTFWLFKNIIKEKTPKLIVVDCYGLDSEYKYATPEFLHSWMDIMPFSLTKVQGIMDLMNDSEKDKAIEQGELDLSVKATASEYLWDYCIYHSRWSDLYEMNFATKSSPEKGAESRINVFPMEKISEDTDADFDNNDTQGCVYLRKIIEECQKRNINIILTYLPAQYSESDGVQIHMANQIAREYDVPFVDFFANDKMDYSIDFYDNKHLNPIGAAKVTNDIGQYIIENSYVQPANDDRVEKWDGYYREYIEFKNDLLRSQEDVTNALVFVSDKDYDCCLEIDDEQLLENETNVRLLELLGADSEIIRKDIKTKGSCIITIKDGVVDQYNNELPAIYDSMPTDEQETVNAGMMVIRRIDKDGNNALVHTY